MSNLPVYVWASAAAVIIGAIVALGASWLQSRAATRAGIAPAQERLTALLRGENDTLRATLNSLQAQITELRAKNADLTSNLRTVQNELDKLKQENFELRQDIAEYRQQLGQSALRDLDLPD